MSSTQALPETFGAELEKTLPAPVASRFFTDLSRAAQSRGSFDSLHYGDNLGDPAGASAVIGCLSHDLGEQGLDNNRCLLETSFPICRSLDQLADKVTLDLSTTTEALRGQGLGIVNLSVNPLLERSAARVRTTLTPRWIYAASAARGWDLRAALDAPSQNSPSTGITLAQAARALTVIEGASAAIIALFANSPFADGGLSGYKASRLLLWRRFFAYSAVGGDHEVRRFPRSPYRTLGSYFRRMFGPGTAIRYVGRDEISGASLKSAGRPLIVDGWPSVLRYLTAPSWQARPVTREGSLLPVPVRVIPQSRDIERSQTALFSAARFRFRLKDPDALCPREFARRCQRDVDSVEDYLQPFVESSWIEGRDPCANYPDARLQENGPEFVRSLLMAPSAMQTGLLRNADKTARFLARFPWKLLGELRGESIRRGLHGESGGTRVRSFAQQVLELAAEGLTQREQMDLRYPEYVLRTGKNGADRALEMLDRSRNLSRVVNQLTIQ
jgi:hypothetical protein